MSEPARRGGGPGKITVALAGAGFLLLFSAWRSLPPSPPPVPTAVRMAPDFEDLSRFVSDYRPPRPLARSVPTHITVPAIDVDADVGAVDAGAEGSLEVPPLSRPMVAGWYRRGPAPGQPGGAVVLGHVDARSTGPAVFYRLGEMKRGQLVAVTRKDRRVAVFRADSIEIFPKDKLPAQRIYGPGRTATLSLITCGGRFDRRQGEYQENTVVFATLAAIAKPDDIKGRH